jgi:hypothetical protein
VLLVGSTALAVGGRRGASEFPQDEWLNYATLCFIECKELDEALARVGARGRDRGRQRRE